MIGMGHIRFSTHLLLLSSSAGDNEQTKMFGVSSIHHLGTRIGMPRCYGNILLQLPRTHAEFMLACMPQHMFRYLKYECNIGLPVQ